ncbi:hypothetical protein BC828DRAFT_379697 [Blastocladiella britannica]|nr:hypothetical protein BC828DRAFT_379697 [Blastocladiella britannica]
MLHLLGVNLPDKKSVPVALSHFYGIGRPLGATICHQLSIHPHCKLQDLTDAQINSLGELLNRMTIEGDLKRDVKNRVLHHRQVGTVTGRKFELGLPVRGQRSRTNGETANKLNRRWLAKDFSTMPPAAATLLTPRAPLPVLAAHHMLPSLATRALGLLKRII